MLQINRDDADNGQRSDDVQIAMMFSFAACVAFFRFFAFSLFAAFLMEVYKHKELTGAIIGCAMRVHGQLGPGFPEVIYQRCLAIEFRVSGVPFDKELELPLYYRGENVGSRRVDFLADKMVLVELKAVGEITSAHYSQVLNYLQAYRLEVALLLNFGEARLNYKRIVNTPLISQPNAFIS